MEVTFINVQSVELIMNLVHLVLIVDGMMYVEVKI
jgi:hypothetical protein